MNKFFTTFLLMLIITSFFCTQNVLAQVKDIEGGEIKPIEAEAEDIITSIDINTNTKAYAFKSTTVLKEENEIENKRTSNTRTFTTENPETFELHIYPSPQFYYDQTNNITYQVDYATTTKTNFDYWTKEVPELLEQSKAEQFWSFLFNPVLAQTSSTTFYTSAGDGDAKQAGNGWATVRAGAGSGSDYTSTSELLGWYEDGVADELHRGFMHFDSSALPDTGYQIDSASLFVKQYSSFSGNPSFTLTKSTVSSNIALANGDFVNIENDAYSTSTPINSGTWTEIILNSAGLGNISLTGWSKFALRITEDVNNTALTAHKYARIYFSEQAGTADDPYLKVIYSVHEEEEEETTTGTTTVGSLPIYNDIGIITGQIVHYTTSTTTPSEVEYITYHVPFLVWLVFWLILSFIFGRLLIEFIIRLRK